MIRHVVVIRFIPDADQHRIEDFAQAVAKLPDEITEVVDFSCGPDVGKAQGGQFEGNWDFVVQATFRSMADYRVYADHPAHHRLKDRYLAGLMQDRAGIKTHV